MNKLKNKTDFLLVELTNVNDWDGCGWVVGARIMNELKNKTNFLLLELTSVNDG